MTTLKHPTFPDVTVDVDDVESWKAQGWEDAGTAPDVQDIPKPEAAALAPFFEGVAEGAARQDAPKPGPREKK